MISPCIRLCVMDAETGLCLGCGRTLDEIARWSSLSDAERQAVMDDLPRRLTRTEDDPSRRLG
jgi:predicted Fe-S protein YdhL (DUF1289 family)